VTPKSLDTPSTAKTALTLRTLADLPGLLEQTEGLRQTVDKWQPGQSIAFDGVFGGIRALLASTLARHTSHVLVIVPQAVDADIVSGDCMAFGTALSLAIPLSASDGTPDSIRDADFAERLQVLQKLRARQPGDPMPMVSHGLRRCGDAGGANARQRGGGDPTVIGRRAG